MTSKQYLPETYEIKVEHENDTESVENRVIIYKLLWKIVSEIWIMLLTTYFLYYLVELSYAMTQSTISAQNALVASSILTAPP